MFPIEGFIIVDKVASYLGNGIFHGVRNAYAAHLSKTRRRGGTEVRGRAPSVSISIKKKRKEKLSRSVLSARKMRRRRKKKKRDYVR